MKQTIGIALALSAGLSSAAGMAQTVPADHGQVTVYGIVDTGVEYVTNTNTQGQSLSKIPTLTGSVPSRLGFKGSENLGNNLSAFFILETGLAPATGAVGQGGRTFGRQANLGLTSEYGTLTIGRQFNMTYYSMLKSDVLGASIHAMTNMDSYLPNVRSDNAIGYMGTFSGITVGATYSLGRDASSAGGPAATNCPGEIASDPIACRQGTALIAYDSATWGVAGSIDKLYGGPGAANGLSASNTYVTRAFLNAYHNVGEVKIGAGLMSRKTHIVTNSDADLFYIGASYPFAHQWVIDTQLARLNVIGLTDASTLLASRLSYHFSRRTTAYASIGHITNKGAAAISVSAGDTVGTGMNQTGIMTGIRHAF